MYCFDTSVIIDIFRGDEELKTKVSKEYASHNVFITPVTLCELYKGAYLFHNPEKKVQEVDDFVSSFSLINIDKKSCKEFGKIYFELKKKGQLIEEFDIIIASIVKVNNLILITRDKHFKNLGIKVNIW